MLPSSTAIIMRARNEMPYVQRVLDMLQRQGFRDYVLYAVDSGSDDGTFEALQAACPPERLERIPPESYAPGKVINHAIERTEQDVVVLLNADAVPLSEHFLEILLGPLQRGKADAVFARQRARPDARFIVAYDYQRAYASAHMAPDFFSAVACAFKRPLWERHRFRPEGYAEDLAWARSCMADGARFCFVPEAEVEHSHNYTLKALYRKRRRQAVTFDDQPHLPGRIGSCLREMGRDLLHACRKWRPDTIPYNLAYRLVIHTAIHQGLKEAGRRSAEPADA